MRDDPLTQALETAINMRRHLIEALSFGDEGYLRERTTALLSASQRLVAVAIANPDDRPAWIQQDVDHVLDRLARAGRTVGMSNPAGEMALRILDAIFEHLIRILPDRRTDLASLIVREVAHFDARIARGVHV